MLDNVKNYLYRNPQFYEKVYPEPNDETPTMCRLIFDHFLSKFPNSILDVGCGTGRDINSLSQQCNDCVGIDYLSEMIQFAQKSHPHIKFHQGDMRTFRLNRDFDAILCMGSTFLYALTNKDIDDTVASFSAHSHKGTLLVLDINNYSRFLNNDSDELFEREVKNRDFEAKYVSKYSFDIKRQLAIRKRTWTFPDGDKVDDYCEYRMLFPQELEFMLSKHSFIIQEMYDNMQLESSDLTSHRLYVVAKYEGD